MSTMTRQNYRLIANVFKSFLEVQIPQDERDLTTEEVAAMKMAHNDLARALAFELQHTNDQFNENKFLTACGLKV